MTDSAAGGESGGKMTRFEHIYRQNFPFVWAAAHRCGVPDEAVDDVVQDVFLAAHRRLDELDWEVSPRGWLYAVTRNLASKHRRSRVRRHGREREVGGRDGRSNLPHRRHDAARTALAMLARIDAGQREVFVQAELLGMTAPEIAADLGIPLNTVYSRLRLARRRLSSLIGEETQLEEAIGAVRRGQQPSAAEQRRNRAALMVRIGAGWGALSSTAVLGIAMAGLAAVAVAVVSVSEAPTKRPKPRPEAVVSRPATTLPEARSLETPPAHQETVVASVASSPARPRTKPTARVMPNVRPAASPDTLREEIALLDDARLALRQGQPRAALEVLDTYDSRFPAGQLRAAASTVRARARCAEGSRDENCPGRVTDPAPRGEP